MKEPKKGKSRSAAGQRSSLRSKALEHKSSRPARSLGPPPEGLFRDIVLAPEREQIPEAAPLVSISKEDEPAFLDEVGRRSEERIVLRRRGVYCGEVAVLRPEGLLPPRPRRRRREVIRRERWGAGSPLFLPGALTGARASLASAGLDGLFKGLQQPGGLASFLEAKRGRLGPEFGARPEPAALADPERDIERLTLASPGEARELWLKTGRLSTHEGDRSLRLRLSFGVEGDDDNSDDEAAQARVGELAARLLPGARSVAGNLELRELLEGLAQRKLLFTQHIAYWNTPQGGARFHHDAFDQDPGTGQLGVVYAQLTGSTLWLALSIEDLHQRMREFVGWLEGGDMDWLRASLESSWKEICKAVGRRASCLVELAKPSCGVFASFVDGPEFSTFLADAGHALHLQPGDVLVLPNHGLERTAMHSVFSASSGPGYALSVALRGVGPSMASYPADPSCSAEGPTGPEDSGEPWELGDPWEHGHDESPGTS